MTTTYPKLILISIVLSLQLSLVKAQTEYIVTVNPATGIPTKIDSIPGVRWLQSYSTYNESTKEYTVMGTWEPGQSPVYLYTLDAVSGHILLKPLITTPNKYISIQYSKSTGILYGIIYENATYHLARIDKTTGSYTILNTITGIDGVGPFVIDEENQRLYLRAVDSNPNFALWTIDLVTGNIIYHVSTQGVSNLRYDNITHKLYALSSRPGPVPNGPYITSICTVNPATGAILNIADLPGITGIVGGDHGTLNENDHLFLFTAVEQVPPVYLYSVDVITGNIVSKAVVSSSGGIGSDNLIFFRYDNISKKTYGLLWEVNTIKPPVDPVNPADSSCRLTLQTRIYPNPFKDILSIDKNPTACSVTMNLYNVLGQFLVKGKKINDGHNEIRLPPISSGIYYYEFISGGITLLSGNLLKTN